MVCKAECVYLCACLTPNGTKNFPVMIRKIYVSTIEEIDFENFGVHFSENENYSHSGGGSNGLTDEKRFEVCFYAEAAQINEDATNRSREEYPREQELVLEFNQSVQGELFILDTVDNYMVVDGEYKTVNTGTRADKWV